MSKSLSTLEAADKRRLSGAVSQSEGSGISQSHGLLLLWQASPVSHTEHARSHSKLVVILRWNWWMWNEIKIANLFAILVRKRRVNTYSIFIMIETMVCYIQGAVLMHVGSLESLYHTKWKRTLIHFLNCTFHVNIAVVRRVYCASE